MFISYKKLENAGYEVRPEKEGVEIMPVHPLMLDWHTMQEQWQQAGLTLKRVQHAVSEFPRDARVAGTSGVVLLWAVVDARGAVGNLCVVDASPRGYGFELAAMEAVGQWVYEPPTQAGQPAPLELLTRITFELGADTLLPYRALLDPYFSKP